MFPALGGRGEKELEAAAPLVERTTMSTKLYPSGVIEGPTRRYLVKAIRCEGDLSTVLDATYSNGGGDSHVLIKVSRDKADNDLVWNEAGILGYITPAESSTFANYIPKLLDAFEAKDGHRVNVFAPAADYIPLTEVMAAYPKGVDVRTMVWMYKRMLTAIGYAHSKGVIHGAILPPHVLIHAQHHGAKIVDWSYALNFAEIVVPKTTAKAKKADPAPTPHKAHNAWEKLLEDADYDPDPVNIKLPKGPPADPNRMYVRAMSVDWEPFYAPEILVKKTPMPCTDIYMAAKVAVAVLGGDPTTNQMPDSVPPQIKAFLQASLMPATRARPQDAWDLHEAFVKLLVPIFGEPKYHPFTMPAKN
jgi:serine/threonine protein kinase